MLLHHPLGPRGDRVEHEGCDRGVFEVGGLTDQRILFLRHAHLQAVTPRRGDRGFAHGARIALYGQCPDNDVTSLSPRLGPLTVREGRRDGPNARATRSGTTTDVLARSRSWLVAHGARRAS